MLDHEADLIKQFIISLDMTILTATLPVCACITPATKSR